MLNHHIFLALCGVLLTSGIGYLINQLPAIKEFPGRNVIILKLTIETAVLVVIYSLWNTPEEKSYELEVLVAIGGSISLLFLVWDIFKLIWMLRKTKTDNNSNDNTTTKLKSPDDWRQELLKVMRIEVETRLNDSLYDDKIIRVAAEDRNQEIGRTSVNASTIKKQPSLVDKFFQPLRSLEVFGVRKTQLEEGKPIIEAFDEFDVAGRLLILGNPGAGKTTLLLELARDLIIRAQNNPDYPIPVLFELTNWRDDKQAIANWLQADLKFRYNVPEKITREWLSTEKLVPLLDSLDELGLSRQTICIDKINEFLQSLNLLSLVVCCREEEYQQGEAILSNLRGAVCLQPLGERQIEDYLRELKCKHLWKGIKNDPDGLGELAKTPLFLNLIPVAYPNGLVSKGKQFNSEDERKEYQDKCRKELFDKYIEIKLGEYHDRKGYQLEDVKWWLMWLAKTMNKHKLKEFYIEKLQPSYLGNWKQRILYSLIIWLVFISISLLISKVMFLLIIMITIMITSTLLIWITVPIIMGFYWMIKNDYDINSINKQTIDSINEQYNIRQYKMIFLLYVNSVMLTYNIIYVIIFGQIIYGLNGSKLIHKIIPNQGIRVSIKNALIMIFISLPLMILLDILIVSIFRVQPASINIFELIQSRFRFSLFFGISAGFPVVQHLFLRLILWKNRSIPWNYARFLKYADERKLINQVGGRFTFIHDKLQEHFARM